MTPKPEPSGGGLPRGGLPLCIVPSSPAVISQLAPRDSAGARLREASFQAIDQAVTAGARSIVVVGSQDKRWYTAHRGSLRAWGASQVSVGGGHYLAELVVRYLCGKHEHLISASCATIAEGLAACAAHNDPSLLIIAIDGSAGLTAKAPLACLPTAADAHKWAQQLLSGVQLPPAADDGWLEQAGVIEPELWSELYTLRQHQQVATMSLCEADASYGVGRYVATGIVADSDNTAQRLKEVVS